MASPKLNFEIRPYSIALENGYKKNGYEIVYFTEDGEVLTVEEYFGLTAEEWIASQNYGGSRPATLLYFNMKLENSNKKSDILESVQEWIDEIMFIASINLEEKRFDWKPAPFSFDEVTLDVVSALQK